MPPRIPDEKVHASVKARIGRVKMDATSWRDDRALNNIYVQIYSRKGRNGLRFCGCGNWARYLRKFHNYELPSGEQRFGHRFETHGLSKMTPAKLAAYVEKLLKDNGHQVKVPAGNSEYFEFVGRVLALAKKCPKFYEKHALISLLYKHGLGATKVGEILGRMERNRPYDKALVSRMHSEAKTLLNVYEPNAFFHGLWEMKPGQLESYASGIAKLARPNGNGADARSIFPHAEVEELKNSALEKLLRLHGEGKISERQLLVVMLRSKHSLTQGEIGQALAEKEGRRNYSPNTISSLERSTHSTLSKTRTASASVR